MNQSPSLSLASLALAATLVLGACSTLQADNAALLNARAELASAQSNSQVQELAAPELATAGTALNRANEAFTRGESLTEVNHLAYLTSQQTALARQTALRKQAEAQVLSAEAERDRTRLAARTSEADSALQQAQRSQQDAQAAQQAAATSQMNAQAAQRQALASKDQSEAALRAAQLSQQQTNDAQARAAQLEAQLRDLNARQTDRGMVVTIGDVLFDTGRAELKPSRERLQNPGLIRVA